MTGATTGLPDLVAKEFRRKGGFALGVSPAENRQERALRHGLPDDGADVPASATKDVMSLTSGRRTLC
ncbi:MAG: hypothetical protein ACREX3_24755 [Gammaproteobacteria bacterium]